jgi:hypothetical protein
MSGYVVRLWMLIKDRSTDLGSAPYYGDESLPDNSVGDIWNDYQFNPPTETVLPNQKEKTDSKTSSGNTTKKNVVGNVIARDILNVMNVKDMVI